MQKYLALGSFVFLITSAASAQTTGAATTQPNTQTTASSNSAQTVTMTGCVGAMSGSTGGFMLSNPMTVPSSAQPGTPTASIPSPPLSATQPASPTGATGVAGTPPAGTAGTAGTPGTVGTTGAAGAPGTVSNPSTVGTAGSAGTPGATGTVGTPAPAAVGPGSTASALNGYRLSGTDMTSWSGQRVQIVGVVIPGATNATGSATPSTGAALPEFRVQTVTPVTGGCPQR